MPLEIFGSTEALLKLIAAYQGDNCRRASPTLLWNRISEYASGGGSYDFYPASDYTPSEPSDGFLLDLASLVVAGHILPLQNGGLEVTESGSAMATMLSLPESLKPLEANLASRDDG